MHHLFFFTNINNYIFLISIEINKWFKNYHIIKILSHQGIIIFSLNQCQIVNFKNKKKAEPLDHASKIHSIQ